MKNIFYSVLIGLLISAQGMAGLPPTTAKGVSDAGPTVTFNLQTPYSQATRINATTALIETGSNNILSNPNGSGGTVGWSASGGTLTGAGTGNSTYLNWASSAAAQTLSSGYVTVVSGDQLSGRNGVVSCEFEAASGTATHTLEAFDATNKLVSTTIASSTTQFQRTSSNFIFPTSGTVRLQISSVNASEPALKVRGCYFGVADGFNISQVSQATLVGSVQITGCAAAWSVSSATPVSAVTQTGCVYTADGGVSAPATNVPGFKINSAGPGEYRIVYVGALQNNTTAAATANFYLCSGSNSNCANNGSPAAYNAVGSIQPIVSSPSADAYVPTAEWHWRVNSASTNLQLEVYMSTSTTNNAKIYGQTGVAGTFLVYRFPTASQTAYTPDLSTALLQATHSTACTWTSSSTSFATLSSGAGAGCSFAVQNNINFGSVTTTGSGATTQSVINLSPAKTGTYWVCAKLNGIGVNTVGDSAIVQLTEGGTAFASDQQRDTASGVTSVGSMNVCGPWSVTSLGAKTIALQGAIITGTNQLQFNPLSLVRGAIEWSIFPITSSLPMPLLTGSVTSNSSGLERVERVSIPLCTTSTCTISSQSGAWVTSVTRSALGQYALNIAPGEFSAAPTCTWSSATGCAGAYCPDLVIIPQSSTLIDLFGQASNDSAFIDLQMSIICAGPH